MFPNPENADVETSDKPVATASSWPSYEVNFKCMRYLKNLYTKHLSLVPSRLDREHMVKHPKSFTGVGQILTCEPPHECMSRLHESNVVSCWFNVANNLL